MLARLETQHEVIAVDLPGHGDTPRLPDGQPPTVSALTDTVEAFLDGIGVARPRVAGNSMGGWIALELARRRRAGATVALSPAGFWTRRESAYANRLFIESRRTLGLLGPVAPAMCATAAGRTALTGLFYARPWRLRPEDAAAAVRNFVRCPGLQTTREQLFAEHFHGGDELHGDIVIGWGARDRVLLPRQGRRAAAAVKGARLVELPGLGHVPMGDDPERVAELILGAG